MSRRYARRKFRPGRGSLLFLRAMLLSSAVTCAFTSVCASLGRRHGVLSIHTAKIQTPILKRGADLFLDLGDNIVGFAIKQGVDVDGYIGSGKNSK